MTRPSNRSAEPLHRAAVDAGFQLDFAQRQAAERLERLAGTVGSRQRRRDRVRGLYLWGPVGRGKTWLLDAFYDLAPTASKRRVHFHGFFRDLHGAVHANRSSRHAFDAAVDELFEGCELMCFDEFHLHDVGDAMLVTRLLRTIFHRGVVLVATSNYPPHGLLPNPLYHPLFQPGIDLIRSHMELLEVAGPTDYRTALERGGPQCGFRSGAFVWPGGREQLVDAGLRLPEVHERTRVVVGSRALTAWAVRGDLVWFDFRDLCDTPTSALDMLVVAERFTSWVVSNVPPLAECSPDVQQRFVNLVDVLHDRDAALTLVANGPLEALLAGDHLPPDIHRTASRLQLLRTRPLSCGLVASSAAVEGGDQGL